MFIRGKYAEDIEKAKQKLVSYKEELIANNKNK